MSRTLSIESVPGHSDFRALHTLAGVRSDLRYASTENFVGSDMYSPFDCAWLHRDAARSLEAAARRLAALRKDVCLLVLDALRPQRVQERMWAHLEGRACRSTLPIPPAGPSTRSAWRWT